MTYIEVMNCYFLRYSLIAWALIASAILLTF